MKFATKLLSLAFVTGAVFAETKMHNFYVGVQAGVGNSYGKLTVASGSTADFGKPQFQGGAYLGYLMINNDFAAGVEVYGGADTAKIVLTSTSNENLKRTMYYGAAVRLGYHILPKVLMFVRLGGEGGKWKYNISGGTNLPSKNSISFAPGAGFEMCLTDNVCMRADYRYLAGPTLNAKDNTGWKVKLTQHAFTLGIGYRF